MLKQINTFLFSRWEVDWCQGESIDIFFPSDSVVIRTHRCLHFKLTLNIIFSDTVESQTFVQHYAYVMKLVCSFASNTSRCEWTTRFHGTVSLVMKLFNISADCDEGKMSLNIYIPLLLKVWSKEYIYDSTIKVAIYSLYHACSLKMQNEFLQGFQMETLRIRWRRHMGTRVILSRKILP